MAEGYLSLIKRISSITFGRLFFSEFNGGGNRLQNIAAGEEAGDAVEYTQFSEAIGAIPQAEDCVTDAELADALSPITSALSAAEGDIDALELAVGDLEVTRGIPVLDALSIIRPGQVTLNGSAPVQIKFMTASAPQIKGSVAGPWNFTSSGLTLIATADGGDAETATVEFTQGNHVGGGTAATDISGETDDSIRIAVDGDVDTETYHEVQLVLTGLSTGEAIATALQNAIQALTGIYAAVTVTFAAGAYTITSGTKGSGSKVRVLGSLASGSLAEELKLGTANGGTNTDGTGDCVNSAAVTVDELLAVLTSDFPTIEFEEGTGDDAGKLILKSPTATEGSSLVIGAGTGNTILGFTESTTALGECGLGYATNMENANYKVVPTLRGTAQGSIAGKQMSITDHAVDGFKVACENNSATDVVDLMVFGVPAES